MLDFLTFYAAAWFSAWGLVCYAAGLFLGRQWEARSIVDYATGREETRHECGPKCMAATGPNCECRCKGANHGA